MECLALFPYSYWNVCGTLQAASHPFITGQPHPRDLGALTIADDPLINDRYTRQVQAMQLQYQKDQQEADRKRAQRIRQQVRVMIHELDKFIGVAFKGKGDDVNL